MVDLSPSMVRERLPPRARYSVRQWALVPGYQWEQYASGVADLAVVVLWTGDHLGRLSRRARPRRVSAPGTQLLLGAVAAVTVTAAVAAGSQVSAGLHAMAYRGAVWGTAALVDWVCLLSLTWQVAARAYGPPGGGDPAPRTTGDATPP